MAYISIVFFLCYILGIFVGFNKDYFTKEED